MTGFKTIEEKYGVKVVSEGEWYNPRTGRMQETFKIYSADGNLWENGLTRRGVKAECEKWEDILIKLKNRIADLRAKKAALTSR